MRKNRNFTLNLKAGFQNVFRRLCGATNITMTGSATLALTPALSPEERGTCSLRFDVLALTGFIMFRVRELKDGAILLPLPGERVGVRAGDQPFHSLSANSADKSILKTRLDPSVIPHSEIKSKMTIKNRRSS